MLGYFLSNCGTFIKLSINQIPQSLNVIIWYTKLCLRKLSFGINTCSYFIGSFQNVLEKILTTIFLGIEVGLKISLFADW